ncbi:MAG: hypothetical protein K6T78_11280 [Alicyclobacillus sp.]|nr:hypothetical protein [Alicyclobacillus sp.]
MRWTDLDTPAVVVNDEVVQANRSTDLRIGDKVRILPAHVCVMMNMCRTVYLEQGGKVTSELAVDAHWASR